MVALDDCGGSHILELGADDIPEAQVPTTDAMRAVRCWWEPNDHTAIHRILGRDFERQRLSGLGAAKDSEDAIPTDPGLRVALLWQNIDH